VEWAIPGAAGINVNYFYFDGAMKLFEMDRSIGNDLYIYLAYTQPENLGHETGGSYFNVRNLTAFNAFYGLAV
jgi:hypothetical protein